MGVSRSKKVTIVCGGETSVHIVGAVSDYATLCGLDGADEHPAVDQHTAPTSIEAKIDCEQCRAIWETARGYRPQDFTHTERK